MNIRRMLWLALPATVSLALVSGVESGIASTKFSYSEEIAASGALIVHFEEGSLKRFEGVNYQLDATAISRWGTTCAGQPFLVSTLLSATVERTPDARGRVDGTLTLTLEVPPQITCPVLDRVDYTNVTLTNLTSGHVYRLDSLVRAFP